MLEKNLEANCYHVREAMSAWLDGELPEGRRAEVAAHLAKCAGCRRELDRLAALDAALGSLTAPVPPQVAERVLARLKARGRRPRWQNMALAASLIIGVILGGAIARDFYPTRVANGNGTELAALEDFHDFPQGSLGSVLVSYQAEEGNGA